MALGYIGFRALLHLSNDNKKKMQDPDVVILDRKLDIIAFLRSPAWGHDDMTVAMGLASPLANGDVLSMQSLAHVVATLCNQYLAFAGTGAMAAPLSVDSSGSVNIYEAVEARYGQFAQSFEREGGSEAEGVHLSHAQEVTELCLADVFVGVKADYI
jgi:hypothetical protein